MVKELAELFSVSPSYIRYLFKEWCRRNGKSPEGFKKLAIVVEDQEGKTKTIILSLEDVSKLKSLNEGIIDGAVVVFDVPLEAAEWIKEYLSKSWKKANRVLKRDRSFLKELDLTRYYEGTVGDSSREVI